MSENIFQVQSIENDIKYHEEKIEKIKAVAAKEVAWQQEIIDFLRSKLTNPAAVKSSPSVVSIAEDLEVKNQKRAYTKPGLVEDKIIEILKQNPQGLTAVEIFDSVNAAGIKVLYGTVDSNIRSLLKDSIIIRLSRPEVKRGIKYGLANK